MYILRMEPLQMANVVLIDGQQRITALMAAVSGLEVLDEDFNRDRIKIAFNPLCKRFG